MSADAPEGEPRTVRVAGVDMGSNTTRLVVADVHVGPGGAVSHEVLSRRSTTTRLAEGVDARGILLPLPITRVRNALVEFRREAAELGAVFVLACATSAVRDADNGEAFLGEVEHAFGFRAELLDGTQEALTTWAGVTSDPGLASRARVGTGVLVDIGGGSSEVVLTRDGELVDHHSFQLGSVRVTERHLPSSSDRIAAAELAAAREAICREVGMRFSEQLAPDLALAVAGTATTASAILAGLDRYDPQVVHGYHFTRAEVDGVIERLAGLALDERRQVAGLAPARAPVIVGGLLVLSELMDALAIVRVETSECDILDGIALRAGTIALREEILELPQPFGNTIC